ncbi:uncharacterized protein RB166_003115 [Leptodactylus fuscus]
MMEDAERRLSAWKSSKTALSEQDALNLLQEFAEQKRKEREKDPQVKLMKAKYRLKAPTYPSPGNVLHTGRQLPRTPGPGILPLLPSQKFEPRMDEEEDEESFGLYTVKTADNMVPCGRQLERTPTKVNVLREIQVNVREGEDSKGTNKSEHGGKDSKICDVAKEGTARSKYNDENCEPSRTSITMVDLENLSSGGGMVTAQKELISEDVEACSRPMIHNNRRISEMPVQGLNQMRISGVLKKMAGYECRNEDLEFLKHMENQEKAKVLKKELFSLRKDLTATNQEKELVLAKKEKIEEDIEKMKLSIERIVRLGRGLLSGTQDPAIAGDLSPDDVLRQLNSMSIHNVHQQTRLQLVAAEKELAKRQQEAVNRTSLAENQRRSLTLKVESSEQNVKKVQCRIKQLKASVQKKRQQISYCMKHVKQNSEMSEEEREKMKRRLQRILHRKDNYLERERILQKLKEELN